MSNNISPQRKAAYYAGTVIMVVGGLLFFSVFLSAAINSGNFNNFEARMGFTMFRAIAGMALLVLGSTIRSAGARGLAGSGIVLNPEKAREDLSPYSRMAGGMVKDALVSADLNLGGKTERVIMIKCQACGKLNEEDSKFCQECGRRM